MFPREHLKCTLTTLCEISKIKLSEVLKVQKSNQNPKILIKD
jgi:hypothetical protein